MGDDRHREATGKLLHDLAVAYRTDWTASGAAAWLPMITSVMTRNFHYASAVTYVSNGPVPDAISAQLLRSNLDAGLPVVLDIASTTEAHSVVGDGYGYQDGALYIHVNMGWSGRHDAWYNMPDIDTPQIPGATFGVAHYNISPDKRGALLTGRVTDPLGAPVAGASVTATSGGRSFSGTSNAQGIYALWVDGDQTYGVTATSGGHAASIGGVLVPAPRTENFSSSASPYNSKPGNSAGNDIAFAAYTSLAVTGADEVTGGQTSTYTATAGYAFYRDIDCFSFSGSLGNQVETTTLTEKGGVVRTLISQPEFIGYGSDLANPDGTIGGDSPDGLPVAPGWATPVLTVTPDRFSTAVVEDAPVVTTHRRPVGAGSCVADVSSELSLQEIRLGVSPAWELCDRVRLVGGLGALVSYYELEVKTSLFSDGALRYSASSDEDEWEVSCYAGLSIAVGITDWLELSVGAEAIFPSREIRYDDGLVTGKAELSDWVAHAGVSYLF